MELKTPPEPPPPPFAGMTILLQILFGGFLILCLLVWIVQDRLIFFPPHSSPVTLPSHSESVTITAEDGTALKGWFVKSERPHAPVILYFGGNAEEVSWLASQAARFSGWAVLAVNYRGYGESGGHPSEKALFADALKIYDYVATRPDIDPARIALFGRSLGTGVAVYVASQRKVRGVLLASPYTSLTSIARHHYPYLPVSLLLRHHFDALSLIPKIDAPLLCLAADHDNIIPTDNSRMLFLAWKGKKTWLEFADADHDNLMSKNIFWDAVSSFLVTLE